MLTVKEVEVFNFPGAIRGMRNPLNSWDKSDSYTDDDGEFVLGENDLNLAKRLIKAGSDHRKFLRQILVSLDITAPLYWWKEFDTYKVATTANSTSTMHTLSKEPILTDAFSLEAKMDEDAEDWMCDVITVVSICEKWRQRFVETKKQDHWEKLIKILPCGFNQTRTVTLNYEVLRNIYHSRKGHKLREWQILRNKIEKLPYGKELICDLEDEECQ